MSNEKIIERIKKILARAQSSNVHEAATAAALAQELQQKHKLSEADIKGWQSDIKDHELAGDGFDEAWRFALITVVAKTSFCRTLRVIENGRTAIRIIGLPADFETAKSLYEFLVGEIDRLCELELGSNDDAEKELLAMIAKKPASSVTKKDSFRRGAVLAIQDRLLGGMNRFSESSQKALVLVRDNKAAVDGYVNQHYHNRERSVDLGRAADDQAMWDGYMAGSGIPIPGRAEEEEYEADPRDLDESADVPISVPPEPTEDQCNARFLFEWEGRLCTAAPFPLGGLCVIAPVLGTVTFDIYLWDDGTLPFERRERPVFIPNVSGNGYRVFANDAHQAMMEAGTADWKKHHEESEAKKTG